MPFDGFSRVGGHPAPGHEDTCQAILRDRTAEVRSLQEEARRRRLVLRGAFAVELGYCEFHHRVEVSGNRRLLHEAHCLARILRYASTFFVHGGERVLRLGIAGLGRGGEQFARAPEVLRKLLALQIEKPEIVGGARMAELGGGIKQASSLLEVARPGTALEVKHCKSKECVAVAFRSSEL